MTNTFQYHYNTCSFLTAIEFTNEAFRYQCNKQTESTVLINH